MKDPNKTVTLTGVEAITSVGSLKASRTYDFSNHPELTKEQAEARYAQLERTVIDIVKRWHELRLMQAGTSRTLSELKTAVEALISFEAQLPH